MKRRNQELATGQNLSRPRLTENGPVQKGALRTAPFMNNPYFMGDPASPQTMDVDQQNE